MKRDSKNVPKVIFKSFLKLKCRNKKGKRIRNPIII